MTPGVIAVNSRDNWHPQNWCVFFVGKSPNGFWLPPLKFQNCSFGQGLNGRLFSPMHWQCIGIPLVTGLAIIVLLHSQSWREDWNGWCFKVSNFQYYDPFEFLRTFTAISLIFWASQLSSNVIQFNSILSTVMWQKCLHWLTEVCFWCWFSLLCSFPPAMWFKSKGTSRIVHFFCFLNGNGDSEKHWFLRLWVRVQKKQKGPRIIGKGQEELGRAKKN